MKLKEWLTTIIVGILRSFECLIILVLIITISILLNISSNTKSININEIGINVSADNNYQITNGYYATYGKHGILFIVYHKNDYKE